MKRGIKLKMKKNMKAQETLNLIFKQQYAHEEFKNFISNEYDIKFKWVPIWVPNTYIK